MQLSLPFSELIRLCLLHFLIVKSDGVIVDMDRYLGMLREGNNAGAVDSYWQGESATVQRRE